jgi:hypothetical protein
MSHSLPEDCGQVGDFVGAALRGRPSLENIGWRNTGGHGVPPLQINLLEIVLSGPGGARRGRW